MSDQCQNQCKLTIDSNFLAVRDGLTALFAQPFLLGLAHTDRAMAETVLAEVLNNVVEHAYATTSGQIEIRIGLTGSDLAVDIQDNGAPLPDGALPAGILNDPDPQDPPEGGFGWFLIRSFSQDLTYRRIKGRNHLSFRLPHGPRT